MDRDRDERPLPGSRGGGVPIRQLVHEEEFEGSPPSRSRSNDQWRAREPGREPERDRERPSWRSWDDDEAGHFEQQDSVWAPAWQRDQPPSGQRPDQPVRGSRARRDDWDDWDEENGLPPAKPRAARGARGGGRMAALGERSAELGRRAGDLGQTGYVWAVNQRKRILSTRRGRIISALVVGCLLLAALGSVGLAYAEYHHVKSQATVALADLKAAETDLKTLETNPFDTTAITQAQDELGQANVAFVQMNDSIQHIPGVFGLTPIVGSDVSAVLQIGPIAVEATQAGVLGCEILGILAPKLKDPLATNIAGVNSQDISTIDADFNTLYSLASTMLQQVQQLPPSAASLDPRLGSLLASVSTNLPQFQQGLQDAKGLMAVLPQLLGVGKPANYLLEVMDSTELRPGGGFMGNIGDLTLSGGRMQGTPEIKDVDLIDGGDNCSLGIKLPSQFSWFTSGCPSTLLLQDSNLDPDFPSNAQRAIQAYNYADGSQYLTTSSGQGITSFQGVIAITPWLIENMLQITGPVTVTTAHGATTMVNSTNLTDQIHYYQLNPSQSGSETLIDPDPVCHGTTYRKCFTASLFYTLLKKLGTFSSTDFGPLGKLLISSIHTKDLQIYLTEPGAEALLLHHDLASALNAPKSGDGLMVVDANVDGIKANNFINYTWVDQVSLDSSGNATHHLTLTYDYPDTEGADGSLANSYPSAAANRGCPAIVCYQDWLRIYIPSNSTSINAPSSSELYYGLGGAPKQTTAFNMTVIQGLLYLPIGFATSTVSTSWTVPHAAVQTAGGGWLYQYAIEKQAGINTRPLDVTLTLPSCAHVYGTPQGFTTPTADTAVYKQPALLSDTNLSLQYTC
ncbi:MAG: DUF4012 domain-containing protein [Ktedonobacterales bacterium]